MHGAKLLHVVECLRPHVAGAHQPDLAFGARNRRRTVAAGNRITIRTERNFARLEEVARAGLLGIFVYAFFKFGWAYRLFNYCVILVGALPPARNHDEQEAARVVHETTAMNMPTQPVKARTITMMMTRANVETCR